MHGIGEIEPSPDREILHLGRSSENDRGFHGAFGALVFDVYFKAPEPGRDAPRAGS
ncbi:MAG: hypothetical protein GY859_15740 [Desulfobacterales bacterium]|nr:hypothetical protein [Desulfobacterales bacterium]